MDFDFGAPYVVHSKDGTRAELKWEKPDVRWEPTEIYEGSITFAMKEEDANRKRLMSDPDNSDKFEFKSPLSNFLKTKGDMNIAWLFDDSNPKTTDDKEAFIKINKWVKTKSLEIQKRLKVGTSKAAYQKSMAKAISKYIKRLKSKGGLGITFDPDQKSPQKNIVQTIKAGKATCIEFTNLYYAIARQAGLRALPVEVFKDASKGFVQHLRICVITSDGKHLFFDLDPSAKISSADKWSFISKPDLLGYDYTVRHYLNKKELEARKKGGRAPFVERAASFSRRNYYILSHLGVHMARNYGNIRAAIRLFLKSANENPFYTVAYFNLHQAYDLLGMKEEAEQSCNYYKQLTGEDFCI